MQFKILVIEDEADIRDDIKMLLVAEGYSVDVLADGNEILPVISKGNYDLVLCDIMMPGKDGYEVFQDIKSHFGFMNAPSFIFVTAKADRSDLRRGMEIGADDYITKPFARAEILNAIKMQISKREELRSRQMLPDPEIHQDNNPKASTELRGHQMSLDESVFINSQTGAEFIKLKDIKYIQVSGDYANINSTDKKVYVIRKSIRSWLDILPKEHFLQINRTVIVNILCITKVEKWFNYTFNLYLLDEEEPFKVSQSNSRLLRKKLNKL